jgi:electron transfer flavoprotein alpha subunit
MNTFVYLDHFKGNALPASWEAIGVGKRFGNVIALVLGSGIETLATTAFEFGADEVVMVDDPCLADYRAEAFTSTLSKIALARTPDLLLFPTTTRGRELAAMLAIDLKTGVMVDVTSLEVSGDKITVTRPIYAHPGRRSLLCVGGLSPNLHSKLENPVL